MKVNQIATILNDTIGPEVLGESAIVAEDLSNIVDIGRKLESTSTFGDNFDNFVKKLIDRIGRVIFVDRTYKSHAPNILKDSWEYGSALEKVRCDLPDAEDNKTWSLADLTNGSTVDPFVINKPSVSAKLFNSKTTFEVPITLAQEQVKEAFTSADEMNRFFSMIENRISMKQTLCTDAMAQRTINNLIANKLNSNNQVINLLKNYKAENTTSKLTASTCLTDPAFLRYCAKEIMLYKGFINTASMLYNDEGYVTFTPNENLKLVALSEFAKNLEVYLYADTYNKEFVTLTGYTEIPYWQGTGTDNSFESRSSINMKAINMAGAEFTINKSGILAVMFDEDAAMICNENYRTNSIYNPRGEYWNYFYKYDCMYMNDLAENCIVFIVADEA